MSPSQSILLKCLRAAKGEWVSLDDIIFELWPGDIPDFAITTVRIYIHRLRKEGYEIETQTSRRRFGSVSSYRLVVA